jgi:hypothetical protein
MFGLIEAELSKKEEKDMRVVTTKGTGRFFVEHDGGAGALLQRECGGNKNLLTEMSGIQKAFPSVQHHMEQRTGSHQVASEL